MIERQRCTKESIHCNIEQKATYLFQISEAAKEDYKDVSAALAKVAQRSQMKNIIHKVVYIQDIGFFLDNLIT